MGRRAFLREVIPRAGTALGALGLGFLIDAVWARAVRGARLEREDYRRFVVGSYRVHHNVVGYLMLVVGLFAYPVVLIPLGLGMIVGHGIRDRLFWFVERMD
jgi:hypothetical protein